MTTDASAARTGEPVRAEQLRVGDRVRVKSIEEILSTLDSDGKVEGLPFMPEMVAFAGRTLPVDAVTHRTCGTVKICETSGTTRHMEGAVHLRGVRCDGSCTRGLSGRLPDLLEAAVAGGGFPGEHRRRPSWRRRRLPTTCRPRWPPPPGATGTTTDDPVYSCQGPAMLRATSVRLATPTRALGRRRPLGQRGRAHTALASFAVLAFNRWQGAGANGCQRRCGFAAGGSWPWYVPSGERRRYPPLDLQPGELVEVRSRDRDRGHPRRQRRPSWPSLRCRDAPLLREAHGSLPGSTASSTRRPAGCSGSATASSSRTSGVRARSGRVCRRKIYTYWREAWLRRVGPPQDATML